MPTWGQIKKVVGEAKQTVRKAQAPLTPTNLFLALLAGISASAETAEASSYWAFMVDPPFVRPVTWDNPTPHVRTNLTDALAGWRHIPLRLSQDPSTGLGWQIRFQFVSRPLKTVSPPPMGVFTKQVTRTVKRQYWDDERHNGDRREEEMVDYWALNEPFFARGATSNLRDSPPGMSPWDYPDCPTVPNWKSSLPVWRECRVLDPETLHPVMIPSLRITDWSKSKSAASPEVRVRVGSPGLRAVYEHYGYVPPGSLSTPRMIHSDLWKLAAALRPLKTNSTTGPIYPPHIDLYIQACVPRPSCWWWGEAKLISFKPLRTNTRLVAKIVY